MLRPARLRAMEAFFVVPDITAAQMADVMFPLVRTPKLRERALRLAQHTLDDLRSRYQEREPSASAS